MVVRALAFVFLLASSCYAAPSDPNPLAASPSGTTIPQASLIVDASGNLWTLVSTYPLENGHHTAASGVSLLLYYKGIIYAYASSGSWQQWYIFNSGSWARVAGDPRAGSLGQPIPSTLFGIQTHANWPTVNFGVLGKGSAIVWPYIEVVARGTELVGPRQLRCRRPSE